MVKSVNPGEPLVFGGAMLQPELILTAAGDYDAGEGTRVVLKDGHLVFLASFDGTNIMQGLPIEWVLECISQYTRKRES